MMDVADVLLMCSTSSNTSDTDSRSLSTAAAGSSSRKRSRKDTSSSAKSSHERRRLSQCIAHVLRKPKVYVTDNENVVRDDIKDEVEAIT